MQNLSAPARLPCRQSDGDQNPELLHLFILSLFAAAGKVNSQADRTGFPGVFGFRNRSRRLSMAGLKSTERSRDSKCSDLSSRRKPRKETRTTRHRSGILSEQARRIAVQYRFICRRMWIA